MSVLNPTKHLRLAACVIPLLAIMFIAGCGDTSGSSRCSSSGHGGSPI